MARINGNDILFEIGEHIDWAPAMKSPNGLHFPVPEHIKKYYGAGPFLVKSIQEVPQCACVCDEISGGLVQGSPHKYLCPAYSSWAVGHPQWVTVETSMGDHVFSGKYFFS